ncbi:MAG: hypothetical protein LDL26_03545 [Caenispirillum bisanense]|nr:hypothetical protein [Caenispirillum bisanense]
MKAFLASVAFVLAVMAVTGVAFELFAVSATSAYSRDSARVGHENPVDGRLGWSPDLEPDEH